MLWNKVLWRDLNLYLASLVYFGPLYLSYTWVQIGCPEASNEYLVLEPVPTTLPSCGASRNNQVTRDPRDQRLDRHVVQPVQVFSEDCAMLFPLHGHGLEVIWRRHQQRF